MENKKIVCIVITAIIICVAIVGIIFVCLNILLEVVPEQLPTCTESGHRKYYKNKWDKFDLVCFADEEGTERIDKSEINNEEKYKAIGHDLIKVNAKAPSHNQDGNIEYYHCSRCGYNFSDEQGKKILSEISIPKHTLDYHPAVPPTCLQDGTAEYWYCTLCDKKFSDSEGMNEITNINGEKATGHHFSSNNRCKDCGYVFQYTQGLDYLLNSDGKTYSVFGIGSASSSDIVIPYYYENKLVTSIRERAFEVFDSSSITLTSITIPDSVTCIGNYAFCDCGSLKSITIGNGVTTIGEYAFFDCTSLARITIPDSVTEIGNFAFCDCSSLKSITIGNGVTTIGEYAFSDCTSLASITIPDSVTEIGNSAFYKCTSLASVNVGDRVTSIGENAFAYCGGLKSITIPESVTSIGFGAFKGCWELTSITLPFVGNGSDKTHFGYIFGAETYEDNLQIYSKYMLKHVTLSGGDNIDSYAFCGCDGLKSITIPNSMTTIGYCAFYGCNSLNEVHITDLANWCNIEFNHYYGNPLQHAHNLYLNNKLVDALYIPQRVTKIKGYAFDGCTSITSVSIPDSVTSIGERAFYDCINLNVVYITDLTAWYNIEFGGLEANPLYYAHSLYLNNNLVLDLNIPKTVTEIKRCAFAGFNGKNVTIPNSVTSIGYSAFEDCVRLESVTIPDSVTLVHDSAFDGCARLENITIPDSVTSIGINAFEGCTNLTRVYISDLISWCNIEFNNDSANPLEYAHNLYLDNLLVTKLDIPKAVTEIKDYAFIGCTNIESVIIPNSVTSIGIDAFEGCTNLTGVFITDLGAWCGIEFDYLTANPLYYAHNLYLNDAQEPIIELHVPQEVTEIKPFVFAGFYGSIIILPQGVISIGSGAFSGCINIENIIIPESVGTIEGLAFMDCSNLKNIIIPRGVKIIGIGAFLGCTSLESVTFVNADGWKVLEIFSKSPEDITLDTPSQNAEYLTSTYVLYRWEREGN